MSLVTASQSIPLVKAGPLLDRQKKELFAYVEQIFWETGEIPSAEKVAATTGFPVERIARWFGTTEFKNGLQVRGIVPGDKIAEGVLTPEQIVIANMYLNTWDQTSMRQKLEVLGITTAQFAAWRRDPAFSNYLQKRAEEQFKASDAAAFKTLTKAVEAGDLNATKLYFEMRGRYQPRVQVSINLESVLVRMVEIVSKHIDDPEVIETIATELEQLTDAR